MRQCGFRNAAFFAITSRLEINIRSVLNLFMLFAPLPRSRWTDPSSWPLFFKVWDGISSCWLAGSCLALASTRAAEVLALNQRPDRLRSHR